ncbi:MAG: hypothetical protein ACLTXI_06960 [Collinsella sp.]
MDQSPYLYKIEHEPELLEARLPGDQKLVDVITSGIHNEQSQRAPLSTIVGKIDAWIKDIDFEPTPLPAPVVFSQQPKASGSDKAQRRHPVISRRTALALGGSCVAGIAASAIATGCWGLIDLAHGIKLSLDDYTWEELALISRKIQDLFQQKALAIAETYHLVNSKQSLENEHQDRQAFRWDQHKSRSWALRQTRSPMTDSLRASPLCSAPPSPCAP